MSTIRQTLPGVGSRAASFTRETIEEEARTVELAFSSETPVEDWPGEFVILGHGDGEIDLERFERGVLPLLLDHDRTRQIGRIESVRIAGGVGRAVARFSRSPLGEEVFRDVVDGIRTGVSLNFRFHEIRLESEADEVVIYRATRWSPIEVSIVSVPADVTVGIGRSGDQGVPEVPVLGLPADETSGSGDAGAETDDDSNREEGAAMAGQTTTTTTTTAAAGDRSVADAIAARNAEVGEILALGVRLNRRDLADAAIARGETLAAFRGVLLEALGDGAEIEVPASQIGMTDREVASFSLFRALRAHAARDWRGAELERDAIEAVADQIRRSTGREARGFFLPYDVMRSAGFRVLPGAGASRDLTAGGAGTGAEMVGTDHLAGSFIDALRSRMMVRRLGARVLSGLVGDVDIPKLAAGATAYWLATEATDVTESTPTTAQLTLSPNTVAGRVDLSRRLLIQSSPDAEAMVRNDLVEVIARAIDAAAINGAGSGGEPEGLLNMTGIGDVAGGTNGSAPTYAHMVELETDVAVANADEGTLAYLTTPAARGKLKTTVVGTDQRMVWGNMAGMPGVGEVNGYSAYASSQVPSNLVKGTSGAVCSAAIFGNWSDLVIGEWGVVDMTTDPFTLGDRGGLVVRAFQDVDVGARHVASFSAMQDMLTT